MIADRSSAYCVIGAGPSGLTVLKNLRQHGFDADAIEREDNVGGTWYYGTSASAVYQSTHLISSKGLTEFTDYAMPRTYPAYPSHQQALDYLRAYARHFDLHRHIECGRSVTRVEPAGPLWRVELDGSEARLYRGVVVANGHNWDPQFPAYPGHFSGLSLHSGQYKTPDVLKGKNVLVVGAGNSGCDIAVEAALHAACTFHSARRSYHYLPKFLLGKPIDVCGERLLRLRLPIWLRRAITTRLIRVALGTPENYGLPRPDHRLFETHPIINSQMLYFVGHGRIRPKPDIERLDGDYVQFVDGSSERVDVLVYATGFKISFPFIDREHLNWQDGAPQLHVNLFHPDHERLFVAGLIQPDSGQWGLVDYQAQLLARYLLVLERNPAAAARFRRKLARHTDLAAGIHYVRSRRHRLEVEHFSYRKLLRKFIAQLPAQ